MADAQTPQGLLAVCRIPVADLDEVLAAGPRVVGVLAHVRDPGNAGTVIRAADAAGADAVVVSDGSVDAYAPKVVRSTAGSLFHLPVVSGMPVPAIVERLRARASPSSQRTVPGTAPSTRPTSDGRTPGCSATRRGD